VGGGWAEERVGFWVEVGRGRRVEKEHWSNGDDIYNICRLFC
jgi:hypothetical protein